MTDTSNLDKMIRALTAYDRTQSTRPGFNRYALPQYFAAAHDADDAIARGDDPRKAILGCFNGRLATVVLRSLDLPALTVAEARRGY